MQGPALAVRSEPGISAALDGDRERPGSNSGISQLAFDVSLHTEPLTFPGTDGEVIPALMVAHAEDQCVFLILKHLGGSFLHVFHVHSLGGAPGLAAFGRASVNYFSEGMQQ